MPLFWALGWAAVGVGSLTAATVDVHYLSQDSRKLAMAGLIAAGGYYIVRKAR